MSQHEYSVWLTIMSRFEAAFNACIALNVPADELEEAMYCNFFDAEQLEQLAAQYGWVRPTN
jgi:hypothetical protein